MFKLLLTLTLVALVACGDGGKKKKKNQAGSKLFLGSGGGGLAGIHSALGGTTGVHGGGVHSHSGVVHSHGVGVHQQIGGTGIHGVKRPGVHGVFGSGGLTSGHGVQGVIGVGGGLHGVKRPGLGNIHGQGVHGGLSSGGFHGGVGNIHGHGVHGGKRPVIGSIHGHGSHGIKRPVIGGIHGHGGKKPVIGISHGHGVHGGIGVGGGLHGVKRPGHGIVHGQGLHGGNKPLIGNPHGQLGTTGNIGIGNPSDQCSKWCLDHQTKQYYCCQGGKSSCPPVRPSCPGVKVGPQSCYSDSDCFGVDKCCQDACLPTLVCKKPVQFSHAG